MKSRFLLLATWILFSGCGVIIPATHSQDKLKSLELGMTKEKVKSVLGEPESVSSEVDFMGQGTLWQYDLYRRHDWIANLVFGPPTLTLSWWWPANGFTRITSWWLVFDDNTLTKFGLANEFPKSDFVKNKTLYVK